MRAAFLGALAALALGYTLLAFRLDLLGGDGTLGPGFLPRVLGLAMLAVLAPDLLRRRADEDVPRGTHGGTALRIGALTAAFVALMPVIGTAAAAALYLFASLRVLNPGGARVNLALALALPTLLWLVFARWLNVALPGGLLGGLR